MTRRADLAASVAPIFVSADEGARRCMVGAQTAANQLRDRIDDALADRRRDAARAVAVAGE
jgi:hypothetical protein